MSKPTTEAPDFWVTLRDGVTGEPLSAEQWGAFKSAIEAEARADCEAREQRLREALMRIRDMDYRGNRSMESDIARAALSPEAEP